MPSNPFPQQDQITHISHMSGYKQSVCVGDGVMCIFQSTAAAQMRMLARDLSSMSFLILGYSGCLARTEWQTSMASTNLLAFM